jgi:hypothetical protein
MLKTAPEDAMSLTVGEYIAQLQEKVDAQKKEREEADKAICDKFAGSYIKFSDPDGMFGKEMTYVHIKSIKAGTYTTDWVRTFFIEGTRVFFSSGFTGEREMSASSVGDSMEEDELLNDVTIITKEEFEAAQMQCYLVNSMIDKLRK